MFNFVKNFIMTLLFIWLFICISLTPMLVATMIKEIKTLQDINIEIYQRESKRFQSA